MQEAWEMFLALCKEQGSDIYIKTDAEGFVEAFCGKNPILRGFVAEDNEKIVGSVIYYFGASPYRAAPTVTFKGLYVAPLHRKKGIAKRLMQEVHRVAKEKNCCYVEWQVMADNIEAQKYYSKLGFEIEKDPLLGYVEYTEDFIKKLNG